MSKKLGIQERDQRRYDKANVDCAQGKALVWMFGLALVGSSWTWRTGEFEIDGWG